MLLSRDCCTASVSFYRANVRSTDDAVLGVVSDRYRIVQNEEAFQFTDDLLGEGVTYETAGSLQGGKKVWMLAKLPRKYLIAGDQVVPYLVIHLHPKATQMIEAFDKANQLVNDEVLTTTKA